MAFRIVTGVMGGGKSFFGAGEILACLKQGGVVHTNMPLRLDVLVQMGYGDQIVMLPPNASDICTMVPGEKLGNGTIPKPVLHSDYLKGGVEGKENLVVVDEAALDFDIDSQIGDRGKNRPIFTLVAMCRHVGLDLLFLTQSDGNIDAKLRRMCERQVQCIKVSRIPFFGWLLVKVPFLGDFCRVYTNRNEKRSCGMTWHRNDAEVFGIYDTHGMKSGIAITTAGTRVKAMDITEKKGKTYVAVLGAVCLALLLFSGIKGTSLYGKYVGSKDVKTAESKTVESKKVTGGVVPVVLAPVVKKNSCKSSVCEWQKEDEYPLLFVAKSHSPSRPSIVRTRNGLLLKVGGQYNGDMIMSYITYAGYHYFQTLGKTWVVVRPVTEAEIIAARPTRESKASFNVPVNLFGGK